MRRTSVGCGLALALLALAGCRELPVDELTFRCGVDDDCPPGQSCCRGVCQDPAATCAPVDAGRDASGMDRAPLDAMARDASAPDLAASDAAALDSSVFDAAVTDLGAVDATAIDAAAPDTLDIDAAVPDSAIPDAAMADTRLPDASLEDAAEPDAGLADSGALDASAVPDAAVEDAAVEDAAADVDGSSGHDASGWDVDFVAPAGYCQTAQCYPVPPGNQAACYGLDAAQDCTVFPCDDAGQPALCGQDYQYPDRTRTFTCLDGTGVPFICGERAPAAAGEVVVDSLTGLMWQRTWASGLFQEQASGYCEDATHADLTDWRLPNPHELQSLIDDGVASELFDPAAFPGTPTATFFWSGADSVVDPSKAWAVSFGVGTTAAFGASSTPLHVRCVRAGWQPAAAELDRWRDLDAETVRDAVTGLVWQVGEQYSLLWAQALQTCEQLDLAGKQDWRLPSKKELLSLFDYGISSPASHFPGTMGSSLWSSTTYVPNPDRAWILNCSSGEVSRGPKATIFRARCVRGGP